ncbi:hypothetical protein HKX48_006675 [Thoreauomyces humboldtii]|nr:hypothetical protein HKX48_006675 [Thoreauomyces humboldtii]
MSRLFVSAERETLISLTNTSEHVTLTAEGDRLPGYQIHVNVDWVVNRARLFKTFAVFTGRPEDVALVAVAEFKGGVEEERVRRAFANFEKDGLKMAETGIGVLMMGNPEWFSKASSPCIVVPDGEYDKNLQALMVNINLRRFGCSERSLLSFRAPSQATSDKFYRSTGIQTSPETSLSQAAIGLGMLVQGALRLLTLLESDVEEDGLMCDSTQLALQTFYNEFGPFNNVEVIAADGIWSDPMLITELLRTCSHLKHKLGVLGHAVKPALVANPGALPRQIKHFQKAHGLPVTMMFDRRTIDRLESMYARAPAQAQAVAAVSSTVNVLRSKIEDITGLPTSSRRGDDSDRGDRDGSGSHYHPMGAAGIEYQDLDYFFASWVKGNKRLEKLQSRAKKPIPAAVVKVAASEQVGPASRGSGSSGATLSHSHSLHIDMGAPQRPIPVSPASGSFISTANSSTVPAPVPPTLTIRMVDDAEEDQQRSQTRRVFRGLKDSTSRTLGGIVGKSRLIARDPPNNNLSPTMYSDDPSSVGSPMSHADDSDANTEALLNDRLVLNLTDEDRDVLPSELISATGNVMNPTKLNIFTGGVPPKHFRRHSADVVGRSPTSPLTPQAAPILPNQAQTQPTLSPPGSPLQSIASIDSPSPESPEPSPPPPPLHPHLYPTIAQLTRRLKHLTSTLHSHLPPLTTAMAAQSTALRARLEARRAHLDSLEAGATAISDAVRAVEAEEKRRRLCWACWSG